MSSLRQSLDYRKQTYALLSIRPPFASAILRGEKKFEYRRNIFNKKVDVVLIYVTSPVQRVVAEFDVLSVISEPLRKLWNITKEHAGIKRSRFWEYFDGLEFGHAIAIGGVRIYHESFCPIEQLGVRPPQSFLYLQSDDLMKLAASKTEDIQ